MKIQKAVLTETAHIAVGVLLADVAMCVVFALLRRFDLTVVWGALLGTAFAVGNFFLMGLAVQKAVGKGENVQRYMFGNYILRMLFCGAGMVLGILLPQCNSVAVLVPFLMPKLVIYLMQAMGLYRPGDAPGNEGGEKTV